MIIEISIIVFLIVLGVALILAEIFLLPGITIAGVAGAISLLGGIVYAFLYVGDTAGFITIGASVISGGGLFVYFIKSNAMSKIALNTDIETTVDQTDLKQLNVGDKGKAISRLNPIGKAEFNNITIEAKSITGEYIDEGEDVEIVKVEGYNVLVKTMN